MIKAMNTKFQEMYKRDLIKDVQSETCGSFRKLLVSLLQGNRSETNQTDPTECANLAKQLYDAGEKKW